MRKSLLTTVSLLAVLVFGVAGTCQNKAPKIPAKPSGLCLGDDRREPGQGALCL
jgi:hypothetical protein